MIDYQLLGALIGSAWRERHPGATPVERVEARNAILEAMNIRANHGKERAFYDALGYTQRGECYACGSSSEVGRDGRGVYVCRMCIEGQGQ